MYELHQPTQTIEWITNDSECCSSIQPPYLHSLLNYHTLTRSLCSSNTNLLSVPRVHTTTSLKVKISYQRYVQFSNVIILSSCFSVMCWCESTLVVCNVTIHIAGICVACQLTNGQSELLQLAVPSALLTANQVMYMHSCFISCFSVQFVEILAVVFFYITFGDKNSKHFNTVLNVLVSKVCAFSALHIDHIFINVTLHK